MKNICTAKIDFESKIKKIIIYIYVFLFIYTPNIGSLIGVNTSIPTVAGILFAILFGYYFMFRTNRVISILLKKDRIKVILGISCAIVYVTFVSIINGFDIRWLQNTSLLIQIFNIWLIIEMLKKNNYTKEKMIKLLLDVALIQAFICIVMLIFPELKQIALNSYYAGRQENIWISQNRIYGFSGEYTYSTPIFHGILAVLSFICGIEYNKKYYLYIPFLLLAVFLNGRTGLVVFIVAISIIFMFYILKRKMLKKVLTYVGMLAVIVILGLNFIDKVAPHTYDWVMEAVNQTQLFLFKGELTGIYRDLFTEHFFIPQGISLIFGEGHRVYGVQGYKHSDVGFVNDLFLGGVIYIILLYGAIIKYILKGVTRKYSARDVWMKIDKIISLTWIPILVIANLKGECMRSGIILVGIIFIKAILETSSENYNRRT